METTAMSECLTPLYLVSPPSPCVEGEYLPTAQHAFRETWVLFLCSKDGFVGRDYWSSWLYSQIRILGLL